MPSFISPGNIRTIHPGIYLEIFPGFVCKFLYGLPGDTSWVSSRYSYRNISWYRFSHFYCDYSEILAEIVLKCFFLRILLGFLKPSLLGFLQKLLQILLLTFLQNSSVDVSRNIIWNRNRDILRDLNRNCSNDFSKFFLIFFRGFVREFLLGFLRRLQLKFLSKILKVFIQELLHTKSRTQITYRISSGIHARFRPGKISPDILPGIS